MTPIIRTAEDLKERPKLAQQVKDFCTKNKFTEIKLAEVLGVSRRTIQMIKAGRVTPHAGTLHRWETLVAKYKRSK